MDRNLQTDLFVADILDIAPKGDLTTMEHLGSGYQTPDPRFSSPESNLYDPVTA